MEFEYANEALREFCEMVMKREIRAFVWSSGLEEWTSIGLNYHDWVALKFLHSKTMVGVRVHIFRDPLGRYICTSACY